MGRLRLPFTFTSGIANMTAFVRNLSLGLSALCVAAGIFAESLLALLEIRITSPTEFRWWLIVGMPLVLWLSYVLLNRQPAKTALVAAVQSVGLLALFSAPIWWVLRHAQ